MEETDESVVVIDIGSSMTKVGLACNGAPTACFPTVVGRPNNRGQIIDIGAKDCYIGFDAMAKKDVLNLSYPLDPRQQPNWEEMEKVWDHCYYNELKVNPEDHPVLLAGCLLYCLKADKEKIIQFYFEKLNVPAFYLSNPGVLSLYAAGKTTGITVSVGHEHWTNFPVYEGFTIEGSSSMSRIGGYGLTDGLRRLLNKSLDIEICKNIKEKFCYVAENYEAEMEKFDQSSSLHKPFELPDGKVITIGSELIKVPEMLFKPILIASDAWGIHEQINCSIDYCDIDIRRDLYSNIVLSGGTTMFPGLPERLTKEVQALAPGSFKVKVTVPQERTNSVWIGGSILSYLSTFQTMWVTDQEYDETGPSIVHRKCFQASVGWIQKFISNNRHKF